MDAGGSADPELDAVGEEGESAPVGRARDALGAVVLETDAEALGLALDARDELFARTDGLALPARPRSHLGVDRPRRKVGIADLVGRPLHVA